MSKPIMPKLAEVDINQHRRKQEAFFNKLIETPISDSDLFNLRAGELERGDERIRHGMHTFCAFVTKPGDSVMPEDPKIRI